jgi:hypothetical protein
VRGKKRRVDALGTKEEAVGDFTKHEASSEGGERENGGAIENAAESFCEDQVSDGSGSAEVDGTGDGVGVDQVAHCIDRIIESDPREVLRAWTEATTQADSEWRKHLLQRAAAATEYDADASVDDADTRFLCGCGCGFPVLTDLCEKVGTERRVLLENLITATAVDADS